MRFYKKANFCFNIFPEGLWQPFSQFIRITLFEIYLIMQDFLKTPENFVYCRLEKKGKKSITYIDKCHQ